MTYALIDNDGQLHIRDGEWRAEVGPEGASRVPLPDLTLMAGHVNDRGLLFTEKYPRNVVGSAVLVSLGAAPQPYAGPVVITGWDPTPGQCSSEVRPLAHTEYVTGLHQQVRVALGLDTGETHTAPEWAAAVREFAELVKTAPTPHRTIRPAGPAR